MTTQFILSGPNKKRYVSAAQKLAVSVDIIENCIYGLIHLVHLASKQKVFLNIFVIKSFKQFIFQISNHDFKDSILALGFTEEQVSVISQFYETIKGDIEKLGNSILTEPYYHDLQWRFEVQVCYMKVFQFTLNSSSSLKT